MVIWTRWGILGLLIPCLFIGLGQSLVPPAVPDDVKSIEKAKRTGFALGALLSAAALWPLGRRLNRPASRTPFDPMTGQPNEGVPGGSHTMFFIPLEYWAFIWPGLGMLNFLKII